MPASKRPPIGVTPSEDDPDEPLTREEATKQARSVFAEGVLRPSKHAKDRLKEEKMTLVDVQNIIEAGHLKHDRWLTFEEASWRYRFETQRMAAVVAFNREQGVVVLVTAFRLGGR